jgi:hypothetical protein
MLGANNLTDVASITAAFANIKQPATTAASGVVTFGTSGESARDTTGVRGLRLRFCGRERLTRLSLERVASFDGDGRRLSPAHSNFEH